MSDETKTGKCHARDEFQQKRGQHKPVAGLYDGEPITTCAWCGVTLARAERILGGTV